MKTTQNQTTVTVQFSNQHIGELMAVSGAFAEHRALTVSYEQHLQMAIKYLVLANSDVDAAKGLLRTSARALVWNDVAAV
jgi:hypothetical protein